MFMVLTNTMDQQANKVEEYFSRLVPFKIPLILIAASVSLFVTAGIMFVQKYQAQTDEIVVTKGESEASISGRRSITIDIGGGISHPGVYVLPEGSRVEDAIVAAGGFDEHADIDLTERSVNRAQRLIDGSKLYIPIQIDINDSQAGIQTDFLPDNTSHNMLSVEQSIISINTASQTELETLSGVGPATAQKIIEARPYMNIDELVVKKAVGQKLFERIKEHISL